MAELTHTRKPRKPRRRSEDVLERESMLAEMIANPEEVTVKLLNENGEPVTDDDGAPLRERFTDAFVTDGEKLGGLSDASIVPTVMAWAKRAGHNVSTAYRGGSVIVYSGEHITEPVPQKGKGSK